MTRTLHLIAATLLLSATTAAQADLTVQFIEGAPTDSFVMTNTSPCTVPAQTVSFDLSTSAAGLIFDVTNDGAGVEVFQPLKVVGANPLVLSTSTITDGDQTLDIQLDQMAPNAQVRVTFDMDDTLKDGDLGQIRVSRSEIEGASVSTSAGQTQAAALFDAKGMSSLAQRECAS